MTSIVPPVKSRFTPDLFDPAKSYLFAGSDAGGECAAAMYTLIGSCKLNKIDPESYLRYVFERIADHPIKRINGLLPWIVSLSGDANEPSRLRGQSWRRNLIH